jgi:uncharacterized protein YdgA (DUF945 family)
MKTTGKWIIALLVLALYPMAAWLIGYSIERNFDAALDQLHDRAPYVTVVERRFKRGWYRSECDVTLDLPGATPGAGGPGAAAGSPLQLIVHSDILHGPWCGLTCIGRAHIDSHLSAAGDAGKTLGVLFGGAEPLRARTILGFLGGSSNTVTSPAFAERTLEDGSKITWGGLDATATGDANADHSTLHVTVPRLAFTVPDGKRFEAGALTIDSTSRRLLRSLTVGDGAVAIGRLAFDAGSNSISIDALRSESHSSAADGFMTVQFKTGTGAVKTVPLTLTGLHLDFTLRHLEVTALEALLTALRDANQVPATPPAARAEAVQRALLQQGMAVLSHAPELAIDRVSAASADGEVRLTGTARLAGATAGDFAAGANPAALLAKIEADLDATADDAFVKALPGPGASLEPRLQPLADAGVLTRKGGQFTTKIVYRRGRATFNGKIFQAPPPAPTPRH